MKELTIAISGPPGAGSTTTAKLLAEKLNLKTFSPGRIYKDIATGKFKDQFYFNIFSELARKRGLEIPRCDDKDDSHGAMNLWATSFGKSAKLHEAIDELQIKLSDHRDIVFDGKLSLHMISSAKPKIWLFADIEERAIRSARRDKVTEEKALEIVKKRQQTERIEWKEIYGFDYWEQEKIADIIIDTTDKSVREVVDIILAHSAIKDKL